MKENWSVLLLLCTDLQPEIPEATFRAYNILRRKKKKKKNQRGKGRKGGKIISKTFKVLIHVKTVATNWIKP